MVIQSFEYKMMIDDKEYVQKFDMGEGLPIESKDQLKEDVFEMILDSILDSLSVIKNKE